MKLSRAPPIIVSNAAGSSIDLIKNNGHVVKPGDIEGVSAAILSLSDKQKRKTSGKNHVE